MSESVDSTSKPEDRALTLGITMGDPSGIGPEICLKALNMLARAGRHRFILYGDIAHLEQTARALDIPMPSELHHTGVGGPYPVGIIHGKSGEAAAAAIEAAAQDCLSGAIDAMVTAPIHKGALALTGRPYPGHTEFLASLSNPQCPPPVRMMLVNPHLRVVLNSIHLPLRMAIEQLNTDSLVDTIQITHQSLSHQTKSALRIAVAGLNPHASDGGLFGDEEARIISPAIARGKEMGIPVSGPWAPDSVFRMAWGLDPSEKAFDVVVCLYHDQGLIPIKLLGIDDGVNCTLGLPFIRTSVDHGTAFEIAGQNRANCASLLAAIQTAITLCKVH